MELVPGLSSALRLRGMVREVLEELGYRQIHGQAAAYTGWYFENAKFFAGVDFDDPAHFYVSVKKNLASELVRKSWTDKRTETLRRELDLTSEDAHFFARTAESQQDYLREFVKESMAECAPKDQ